MTHGDQPNFTPNELVWYEKDGELHSSGYKVESLFKTLGVAPMSTANEPMSMSGGCGDCGANGSDGKQFSDLFRFMGVPAGLSSIISENVVEDNSVMTGGRGKTTTKQKEDYDIHRVEKGLIPTSLFDKLTELAGPGGSDGNGDDDDSGDGKGDKGKRGSAKGKKRTTRRLCVKGANKSGKKRTTRKNRR